MRLSTSHHFSSSGRRGLQKFGNILLEELKSRYGVKIVPESARSDIHLTVISGKLKKRAKNILRIDGVYYDVIRRSMNNSIKRSIESSDGVIYQSKWCRKFATTMLKTKSKLSTVVYNGVKQSCFQNLPVAQKEFDKAFICCAHWRINKRLKSIVQSLLEVRKRTGVDLGMYVLGKPDYKQKSDYIKYIGDVKSVAPFYAVADYMCHICHLDACPNAVIEGLSAGLPVVCNNIGGTPEIVGSSGVQVELDRPFDFRYIKRMDDVGPNSVNTEKLVEGMVQVMNQDWQITRPELDISASAKGYYDFFVSLLG